jgi:hypothetical protein
MTKRIQGRPRPIVMSVQGRILYYRQAIARERKMKTLRIRLPTITISCARHQGDAYIARRMEIVKGIPAAKPFRTRN